MRKQIIQIISLEQESRKEGWEGGIVGTEVIDGHIWSILPQEEEEDGEVMMDGFTEEPGNDSGCTAVIALLAGTKLFVANAGDSRWEKILLFFKIVFPVF